MEAEAGIEPAYTALQAAASPLCHPAMDRVTVTLTDKAPDTGASKKVWSGKRDSNSHPNLGKVVLYQLSYSRIYQADIL